MNFRDKVKLLWPKLQANDPTAVEELAQLKAERDAAVPCKCNCGRIPSRFVRNQARLLKSLWTKNGTPRKATRTTGEFFSRACYFKWKRMRSLGI